MLFCDHADLEWKLIYVGSAESEQHDQTLDDVHVGPVKAGKFKFVLQVRALQFVTESLLVHACAAHHVDASCR